MKTLSYEEKVEILKSLLKRLNKGESVEKLREEFRDVLASVSPVEIPFIEQELVREGVPVREILRMCDMHAELFYEALKSREIKGVPKGHPLDLLMKENEEIVKLAEKLSLYSTVLAERGDGVSLDELSEMLRRLSVSLRRHYVKNQMLLFPYLERLGIAAVPRVLWGREDQVLGRIRKLSASLGDGAGSIAVKLREVSREVADLVFRENKILYPTLWALLEEEDWAAVALEADKIGYIVEVEGEWRPRAKPRYPFQLKPTTLEEKLEKLPPEVRRLAKGGEPDDYEVAREGDVELGTGFLSPAELSGLFRGLPLEITFAGRDDRVRFFSSSMLMEGFIRTKTILGRRIEYCHPPRLEGLVKSTVEKLKRGEKDFEVFWTRIRGRTVRVLISAVRSNDGEYLGVLEIVEDFTDILENPEEVKKSVVVL